MTGKLLQLLPIEMELIQFLIMKVQLLHLKQEVVDQKIQVVLVLLVVQVVVLEVIVHQDMVQVLYKDQHKN